MRFLKSFKLWALWGIIVLAACQPTGAQPYPLIVHAGDAAHLFQVELARTPAEQEQGLMFRKQLDDDKGMLFIFPTEQVATFWMKNTYIPLDMLFIRADGSVAHIAAMAKPFDETPITSTVPVKAVLEIAGGQADKRNITTQSRVETDLLK